MTIQNARELLGEKHSNYSDEEIGEILISIEALADIAIETFLKMTPEERKRFSK